MNYAQIREFDIANGVGIRTTIFVTGCTHNCPGCFNKAYMNFNYGKLWTNETTQEVRMLRGIQLQKWLDMLKEQVNNL